MAEESVEKHNGPVSIQQSDNVGKSGKTNIPPKTTDKKLNYVLKRLGLSEAPDCTTGRS